VKKWQRHEKPSSSENKNLGPVLHTSRDYIYGFVLVNRVGKALDVRDQSGFGQILGIARDDYADALSH